MNTHSTKHTELRHWLALHHTDQVGAVTFHRLLEHFETPEQVLACHPHQLLESGLDQRVIEAIKQPDWESVEWDLEWLDQAPNHYILHYQDPAYPPLLRESHACPPLIYLIGDPQTLSLPQLAMVGSRNPTPDGARTAYDFAYHLARHQLVITSGLAMGIDSACHRGALAANKPTIAVLGTGLDKIYPARNRDLAHAIAEQGVLVSEFPIGTPARSENFPRRNRIISGLSMGTLVVEAALRSGSLITARQAVEQGREVFAIPGSIHNPLARGCHWLLRQGAKLVETAEDVISELHALSSYTHLPYQVADKNDKNTENLDPGQAHLLKEMGFAPVAVDELVDRSGLTAEEVSSMMLILELQGHVAPSPGGGYIRVK